jgi:general secretion pathway protein F
MPNFSYRALTNSGEIVKGSIFAQSEADVAERIHYLGLLPIETAVDEGVARVSRAAAGVFDFNRARRSDVTIFTRDIALLLKAGARLDDGLELLANDVDIGKLRPVVKKIHTSILSGETFAEALGHHPDLFPSMYQALVKVGEASGTLENVLETLGNERVRDEELKSKLVNAVQYPAFVLLAATAVLVFFLFFVLPQFSSVLQDFGAKSDSLISRLIGISEFFRAHAAEFEIGAAVTIAGLWALLRRRSVRIKLLSAFSRLPGIRTVFDYYRTALFCRNLGMLLSGGVTLTASLRILVDIMAGAGNAADWSAVADRIRHGSKLSEVLVGAAMLPPMAIRMLRLGEETGQLPVLSGRIADFYQTKLQRSLDQIVAVVSPLAIILISIVVGGLIVSVMTALLSIDQIAV